MTTYSGIQTPLLFLQDKRVKIEIKTVPVLSFFTGAGFLDIGFSQAGFNIIWRNEYDLSFVRGFKYGISRLEGLGESTLAINTASIENLNSKTIGDEAFSNGLTDDIFGMIGGPPCPDFSVGGKNRGGEGNRGKLSQIYVKRILELRPTFFLFENVPGLLRTSKHRHFLFELLQQLSLDYLLDLKILNALEYGVPQDRERVFIVGFKKDWLSSKFGYSFLSEWDSFNQWSPLIAGNYLTLLQREKSWFPWPEPIYPNAKVFYPWPDKSPFREIPPKPKGIPEELMVGTWICNSEEIARLPNGNEGFEPYSEKFKLIPEGDSSKKSFKRLHRWRYSPAAAYGNNEVHLHPSEPRRITVREALRIQSVPDNYALPPDMPLSHKFKTIGNGVPVKLASAVASSFIKMFTLD